MTSWNKQQHVIFTDAHDHVDEWLYVEDARSWVLNDLTAAATKTNNHVPVGVAGFPGGGGGRSVSGYATSWNQQQHVNYVDSLGFINELYYNGSIWTHNSLTSLAPGAELAKNVSGGSAITGCAAEWNKQQHVYYIDVSGHIHELYYAD